MLHRRKTTQKPVKGRATLRAPMRSTRASLVRFISSHACYHISPHSINWMSPLLPMPLHCTPSLLLHSLCVFIASLRGMSTEVSGYGNGYGDLDRCDLFDDIRQEVFRLMETNLWISFKQSYRYVMKSEKLPHSTAKRVCLSPLKAASRWWWWW